MQKSGGNGNKQVAQLSQRDRATAVLVKSGKKWKRIICRHY